jgi:hypothetical protein
VTRESKGLDQAANVEPLREARDLADHRPNASVDALTSPPQNDHTPQRCRTVRTRTLHLPRNAIEAPVLAHADEELTSAFRVLSHAAAQRPRRP